LLRLVAFLSDEIGQTDATVERNMVISESLEHIDRVSNAEDLANVINDYFIHPMRDYPPLPAKFQPERNTPSSHPFAVSHHSVYMKMSTLNVTKAESPDGIPAWF
jgi:Zn-dependent peptidase ImmA (M78 family)